VGVNVAGLLLDGPKLKGLPVRGCNDVGRAVNGPCVGISEVGIPLGETVVGFDVVG